MTTYYADYYRDFVNTYTVYAVAPADRIRFERAFPSAKQISRIQAIRMGWYRVREAKRDGEFWPAGFAERHDGRSVADPGGMTIDAALEDCRIGTIDAIDRVECERDDDSVSP